MMNAAEFEATLFRQMRLLKRNFAGMQHHGHHHGPFAGLTPVQINVLFTICRGGMRKISDLSKELDFPDSHVSNICRKLEKLGYVERVRDDEDQRIVRVRSTDKVAKAMGEEHHSAKQRMIAACRDLPAEDMQSIITGLEKLNALLTRAATENKTDYDGRE